MGIEWQLVLIGVAIGIAVSAPIGPINIMCIQRSLKQGFKAGLFTGVGSVLGDGTFAAIAAFSITSVSDVMTGYSFWIELAGGVFLIGLGLRTIRAEIVQDVSPQSLSILDNTALVGTTYFMTVTNPAMILGFAAFFGSAASLIDFPTSYWGAFVLVLAVMTGSFLWWVFLAGLMHWFRRSIGPNALATINRVSGCILAVFGAVVLVRVLIAEYGQW